MTAPSAADRVGASPGLRVSPVSPLPRRVAVGRGTALFLDGLCSRAREPVRDVRVVVDGREHPVMAAGMPPPGAFHGDDYWWAIVPFEAVSHPRLVRLRLRARTPSGEEVSGDIGVIELHEGVEVEGASAPPPAHEGADLGAEPLIAICMATHEPPIDLFERQIESIRGQTHERWVCVISDDATSPERLAEMRRVLGDDERFALSPFPRRLGFYGNFERALALAPREAGYVAMCDQDDRWYPDRLAALVEGLRSGAKLAYSDMRIIDRAGRVRSETYWSYRRNNHTDFGSLLLANTITGAASLFVREVLDYALPFPPRYAANYHDHWVALVAMALGEVAYVDRPLYDYVQHEGAVLGHDRANGVLPGQRGMSSRRRTRERLARLASLKAPRGMRHFYFTHYCGTSITARVVTMRCGSRMTRAKRRTAERFTHPDRALAWLALRAPRRAGGHSETLRREQALLGGLAWRHYAEWRGRLARRREALSPSASRAGPPAPAPAASGAGSTARPRLGHAARGRGRAAASNGRSQAAASLALNGPGRDDGAPAWLTPILVDYFTRDGSTLLMRLLASSPQVVVEDQYPYERKYFTYLWRWSRLLDRGHSPSDEWSPRELASITQERHSSLFGPPPWHPRALFEPPSGEDALSRRCFDLVWGEFSARAARASAGRAGDPAAMRFYAEKHLDTYLLDRGELPDLELLVLLRDPRDSYVSINAFNRKRGTAGFGRGRASSDREHLDQLIARQRERLRWIAELVAAGDPAVVRYDELVLDTPAVARRLEALLGIELDPAEALEDVQMRRAHVSAASPEASVGRWRSELDPETVGVFRRELGDELEAVGFEV